MYSGTTIGKRSGNILGVHQRIDRIVRRQIAKLPRDDSFPGIKRILYFEGNNGPDGVKRKSPSIDEPWHYIDPTKDTDVDLVSMINDHIQNLGEALSAHNEERAAFEAAWLSHAIVDGLTPAHHYPLGDKIEELFGVPHQDRRSIKEKNIIRGTGARDTISKNWQYWGGKGVFSSHALFEWGVATSMVGKRYGSSVTENDLVRLRLQGYEPIFKEILDEVVSLDVYELFRREGWNQRVAHIVHMQLMPLILKAVYLGWYAGILESERQS